MRVSAANITNLQMEMMKIFSYNLNESQLKEIKQILSDYFTRKATLAMDELWEKNKWSNKTMDKISKTHLRTPYK